MLLDTSGMSHGTAATALGAREKDQEELGERRVPSWRGPAEMGHSQATSRSLSWAQSRNQAGEGEGSRAEPALFLSSLPFIPPCQASGSERGTGRARLLCSV